MGFSLGGIEAYLNQLQYGNAGQSAKNLHQQTKVESIAAEAAGFTPKADRKDGFAPISATGSNATGLKKEAPRQEKGGLNTLDIIKERLDRGERLSDSEMRYLRGSDPGLYQRAKRVHDIRQKFSDILMRAPKTESGKIYREVLGQAQKAQSSDKETGSLLAKAIEKDFADYRGGRLGKSDTSV